MKQSLIVLFGGLCLNTVAVAQLDLNIGGVRVNTAGGVSIDAAGTRINTGKGAVSTPGVRVSGGKVWIDGQQVPADRSHYTSPKTGKHYRINRNQGGNVSVEEV